MKERLKENIRILKEERGLKIIPLRTITEGKNKKSDFSNNLNDYWRDIENRRDYNKDYLLRLIDNNIIGFAIPTGYYNNIIVIDIDNKESSNKEVSTDLINRLHEQETLTIKTAGGGFHFIFRYTDLLKKATTGILGHIDIRTNNLPIFSGIREDGEYNIYKNNSIKKLNDNIIKIILDNIDIYKQTKKQTLSTHKKKTKTERKTKKYDITDKEIKELLEGLPKIYLDDKKEWYKITASLKTIDKKDIWNEWSKQSNKYDEKNNNKIWDDLGEIEGYNNSLTYLFWLYKFNNPNKRIKTIEHIYNDFIELNKDHLTKAININNQYLELSLLEENNKLTIIKSSTNTGKTTLAIDYKKKQTTKKILSITHLKTIADDHYKRFNEEGINIFHYENEKGYIGDDWINENGYIGGVIVINSILKLDIDDINEYIIYLDEITAIIETILNSPTIKERKEIINKFIKILKGCYNIIATDATITDITIDLLESISGTKAKFIINHYKNYQNKKAYFIDDYNEILELLRHDIKNNKTPIICSNSKSRIDKIEIEIIKIKEEYNIKTDIKKYTSTEGDKIKDVNEEWTGYIKMFSPSIVQGVDYKAKEAENIYSFVVGNTTIDPIQVSQQIARNRNPLNTYINIEDAKNKSIFKGNINKVKDYYKEVKETYNKINNKILNHYKNNNIDIDKTIYNSLVDTKTTLEGIEKIDNPITELFYKYKNNQDILRSAYKYNLKQILINKGYDIIDRLFYENKEEIRTKKQIHEDRKNDKIKNKEIEDRLKNNKYDEWINNRLTETDKYKITMDKKIEILNLNKTHHKDIIDDYKETLINDNLFKLMKIIIYYVCKNNKNNDMKIANKNKNDYIENIYNDDDIKIKLFKTLLLKYTDINPYFYSYDEKNYINHEVNITDEEYKLLKHLTKTSKQKPKNKIELLRLIYLLAKKNIYYGLITLKKHKTKKEKGKATQYQYLVFDYSLFHKYLEFIKTHLNNNNICPFIKSYIESQDFKNIKIENIDYNEYEETQNENSDNESLTDTISTISNINDKEYKNPYENIDIEILKENIFYLDDYINIKEEEKEREQEQQEQKKREQEQQEQKEREIIRARETRQAIEHDQEQESIKKKREIEENLKKPRIETINNKPFDINEYRQEWAKKYNKK